MASERRKLSLKYLHLPFWSPNQWKSSKEILTSPQQPTFISKTSLWRTGSLTSFISQKHNNTLVSSHRQSISWSKNFLLLGKLWPLDTSGCRLSRATKKDWHSHYYTITFHFSIFEIWGLESEVGGKSIQSHRFQHRTGQMSWVGLSLS